LVGRRDRRSVNPQGSSPTEGLNRLGLPTVVRPALYVFRALNGALVLLRSLPQAYSHPFDGIFVLRQLTAGGMDKIRLLMELCE
jgi:hypothetical protein